MTAPPLYPFGYGLSYSRFEYGDVVLSSQRIEAGDDLEVEISVRNSGDVQADEIMQLYLSINDKQLEVPISSMVGFQRLSLSPGESKVTRFTLSPDQMQAFDEAGKSRFVSGNHTLHVGGVSPGRRGEELTGSALKTVSFEIR